MSNFFCEGGGVDDRLTAHTTKHPMCDNQYEWYPICVVITKYDSQYA